MNLKIRRLTASEQEKLARMAGFWFAAYGLYYLAWRAGWTLNLDALWLALPLLVVEVIGFVDFLLFFYMAWRIDPPRDVPAPAGRTVDVFITTYNESPELLRSTILASVHMRYPHRTFVLDDGGRPEVRALAESLGAEYIARSEHAHAKAGNINHALGVTSGEFVAVFDADHVPHPNFLERTLGYFAEDERLALVQTPQEFYNLDSIQHSGDTEGEARLRWHEQALFYRVIQPGKQRLNSVFWCGSNAVLRRSALESIGGVATETITEDIHTTIKLHQAGWHTSYHNEVLATGIAPDDLEAFLTQRKRWAQGAMQVLRSRWNPLWARGLSIAQRLSYWASMSTYFTSAQKMVLIVTPMIVLTTGILPMSTFGWDFLAHFAPYVVLGLLANSLCGRGYSRYLDTERYNLLKAFAFLRASLALVVPRRLRFEVTRKSPLTARWGELALALPHVLLLVATGAAIGVAAWRIALDDVSPEMQFALGLTAIWAVYNAGLVGWAVRSAVTRAHRRQSYRFETRLRTWVQPAGAPGFEATVADVNLDGAGLQHRERIAPGTTVQLRVLLPGHGPIQARGVVTNARPLREGGGYAMGVRFVEMAQADGDALALYLFAGGNEHTAAEALAAAA